MRKIYKCPRGSAFTIVGTADLFLFSAISTERDTPDALRYLYCGHECWSIYLPPPSLAFARPYRTFRPRGNYYSSKCFLRK